VIATVESPPSALLLRYPELGAERPTAILVALDVEGYYSHALASGALLKVRREAVYSAASPWGRRSVAVPMRVLMRVRVLMVVMMLVFVPVPVMVMMVVLMAVTPVHRALV
jgi:hypothetical protein